MWLHYQASFPYDLSRVYDLHAGANLVSFPSEGSFHITDALPEYAEEHIKAIIGEGQITINNDYYEIDDSTIDEGGWSGSLNKFEALHGYWIFSDEDISLSIISTGMHLSPEYGLTYREIEQDFQIEKKNASMKY